MKRVVFMGSPDFAVPTLQALLDASDFEVAGVVTQPDRPAGRGGHVAQTPVKALALAQGIEVYQPEKLRGDDTLARLSAWNADVQVVAAYGQILTQAALDVPPGGSINVHASLLPRWRGAAPIQAAIRAGDAVSGITIMQMDAGLDTGPILRQSQVQLDARETGQSLHDKLAVMGGPLLIETLRDNPAPQAQDESLVTYAGQIAKEDGLIDWIQSALEIDRHVRAYFPWPGTFTHFNGKLLKIIAGEPLPNGSLPPGKVEVGRDHLLVIGTGEGLFAPTMLQLEGKKRLATADFLNGNRDIIGALMDDSPM
jgi:methionyl-tRNA formyltransferase